jgi:hypothetical protein
MASNTVPITPGTVKGFGASLTTAQTDKTGATAANTVAAYTATTAASSGQGALVQDITFNSPATTAACCIVIFKKVSGTLYPLKEISVGVVTSSATSIGYNSGKIVLNEWLSPGDAIVVSTTITQTFGVTGNAAEY